MDKLDLKIIYLERAIPSGMRRSNGMSAESITKTGGADPARL